MSLSTQTNKISGVIDFPLNVCTPIQVKSFINEFKSFCSVFKEYYIIYHNRDINSEGEFKTPHLHFLIDATGCCDRKRLSTYLNEISDALNIDTSLISIQCWKNYESAIQYLIHKNDKEKVLYNVNEIITNQSANYLKLVLDRELKENITIDYLIQLCSNYHSKAKVYQILGLENSKKYRNIICDIFSEYSLKR